MLFFVILSLGGFCFQSIPTTNDVTLYVIRYKHFRLDEKIPWWRNNYQVLASSDDTTSFIFYKYFTLATNYLSWYSDLLAPVTSDETKDAEHIPLAKTDPSWNIDPQAPVADNWSDPDRVESFLLGRAVLRNSWMAMFALLLYKFKRTWSIAHLENNKAKKYIKLATKIQPVSAKKGGLRCKDTLEKMCVTQL